MAKNPREVIRDRLSTTDETGRRVFIHSSEVRGKFRSRRNLVHALLLVVLLALPWIKVGGVQSVLFDVNQKRLTLFGLSLWAHDAPLLVLVFLLAVLGITFVTAVWGRIWCGWACPQTVFIDALFRRIERWIDGDSLKRRALDVAPWNLEKIFKRVVKWTLYLAASTLIAHTFLFYLAGTDHVLEMIRRPPLQNWGFFVLTASLTLVMAFDFGWFREQFCTIMCPYGRLQSLLIDDSSLTVTYDAKRGEPRGEEGDCVNCFRCVQVCPTGIDIRNGIQMECIGCTACIDACDDVMGRLKKPTGLVRYGLPNPDDRFNWRRPRTFVILTLLLIVAGTLSISLGLRDPLGYQFVRAVGGFYEEVVLSSNVPGIVNHFHVDLMNQKLERLSVSFTVPAPLRAGGMELITSPAEISLDSGESRRVDLWLRYRRSLLSAGRGTAVVGIKAVSQKVDFQFYKEVPLVGPLR